MRDVWKRGFESALWGSRLVVLLAVVVSVVTAIALVVAVTFDFVGVLVDAARSLDPNTTGRAHDALLSDMLRKIVTVVDAYLLGSFMLIFGFGLYELFLGELAVARHSAVAERLLRIDSLEELKNRLAKVVLLILIVEVFKAAENVPVHAPIDAIYLALTVTLVALSLYLTKGSDKEKALAAKAADQSQDH